MSATKRPSFIFWRTLSLNCFTAESSPTVLFNLRFEHHHCLFNDATGWNSNEKPCKPTHFTTYQNGYQGFKRIKAHPVAYEPGSQYITLDELGDAEGGNNTENKAPTGEINENDHCGRQQTDKKSYVGDDAEDSCRNSDDHAEAQPCNQKASRVKHGKTQRHQDLPPYESSQNTVRHPEITTYTLFDAVRYKAIEILTHEVYIPEHIEKENRDNDKVHKCHDKAQQT